MPANPPIRPSVNLKKWPNTIYMVILGHFYISPFAHHRDSPVTLPSRLEAIFTQATLDPAPCRLEALFAIRGMQAPRSSFPAPSSALPGVWRQDGEGEGKQMDKPTRHKIGEAHSCLMAYEDIFQSKRAHSHRPGFPRLRQPQLPLPLPSFILRCYSYKNATLKTFFVHQPST